MHVITCICKVQPRCPRDHIVNFMSCNTVKTCACLIQGKIVGGIIEIYHACNWYLPKNTGCETRQISLLAWEIFPVSQPVFFWQIPLTSMAYFYKNGFDSVVFYFFHVAIAPSFFFRSDILFVKVFFVTNIAEILLM